MDFLVKGHQGGYHILLYRSRSSYIIICRESSRQPPGEAGQVDGPVCRTRP